MIIALGHRRGVGKNAFAKLLAEELDSRGKPYRVAAFADALYSIAHQLYGWAGFASKEYYEKYRQSKEIVLPALGMTPREVLIRLGTNAIRQQVYDRTWVNLLLHSVGKHETLIITDLRFPNEFSEVKKHGGLNIRIDRPLVPFSNDLADSALAGESDGWDQIILNDGTLEELRGKALSVLSNTS